MFECHPTRMKFASSKPKCKNKIKCVRNLRLFVSIIIAYVWCTVSDCHFLATVESKLQNIEAKTAVKLA